MKLRPVEREVLATYNDAEKVWHIYSDSVTMRGTILRIVRQLGVEVQHVGDHGIEFEAPADALKLTPKRRGHAPSDRFLASNPRRHKSTVPDSPVGGNVAIVDDPRE
jgi:hypothetical protein